MTTSPVGSAVQTSSVIEIKHLSKQYNLGHRLVLQDITLTIEPGQVVGLIGANASGKSTLLKTLLGLLRATSGSSSIYGDDSWDLSAHTKARLGYVSQDFALLEWMTGKRLLDYTGSFYETWDIPFITHLVEEWQLPLDQKIAKLSVGQKQKLAVILAMGHRPQLLILDEPVASLDPLARRQFIQSIVDFTTNNDQNTVLFSTHITSDLERVASHIAILHQGRLAYFGELDQLKDNCKRLRITSLDRLPTNLSLPHMLRTTYHNNTATITVQQLDEPALNTLASQHNATYTIEDLNLEDIFLEFNTT